MLAAIPRFSDKMKAMMLRLVILLAVCIQPLFVGVMCVRGWRDCGLDVQQSCCASMPANQPAHVSCGDDEDCCCTGDERPSDPTGATTLSCTEAWLPWSNCACVQRPAPLYRVLVLVGLPDVRWSTPPMSTCLDLAVARLPERTWTIRPDATDAAGSGRELRSRLCVWTT